MSRTIFKFGYMDRLRNRGHHLGMLKRRKIYVRQWRKHRGLSQERLAERVDMSAGNLSLIERSLQNYTQETLEKLAHALQCEPVDLLIRDPSDPESIWSIWDQAQPSERQQITNVARALVKKQA